MSQEIGRPHAMGLTASGCLSGFFHAPCRRKKGVAMSCLIPSRLEATVEIVGDDPVDACIVVSLPKSEWPVGHARTLDIELQLSQDARALLEAAIREAIKRELHIRWRESERERQPAFDMDRYMKDGEMVVSGYWQFPEEYRRPRSRNRPADEAVAS